MKKKSTNAHKKNTAEGIIQTAHRLFMELGFTGVSTRMIAKECEITQPALYHHFPNKVSIYLAVLIEDLSNTERALQEIIKHASSFREALLEVTVYILLNRPRKLGQMTNDMRQHLSMEEQLLVRSHWTKAYQTPIEGLLSQVEIHPSLIQTDQHLGKLAHVYLGMVHQQIPDMERLELQVEEEIRLKAEFLVTVYVDGIASSK
ncbi:TetR/AcrR family transcriptional regulator [Alkalicoccobacillus porphyridii]|uniref:TetR/AcrR family transcriptional regulator n=1 Tax=Alkalicoccobacillus porphyridii TaxID=2597270 RepID=A0A553ZYM5_9BACI|nr:TetR/AcrR family transcriptional regulator [Alkalicoccobacillus porphyridii]TSB46548.1 TetR/AcrR family transcriptional regulator [Alkalicoccobacillus porphyridii]